MVTKFRRPAAALLLLALAALSHSPARAQQPSRKVNVLLIAVDDLNTALGTYGHPVVKTPNIDRLAARGVRFDRAYCQYPLCNPSRTSVLSGRRPDTTRVFDNTTPPRAHLGDVVLLPEHFKKNGYFTARVGKIAHGAFEKDVKWDVSESRAGAPGGGAGAGEARRPARAQARAQGGKGQGGGAAAIQWQATNNKDEDEPDGRVARRIAQLLEQNKDKPFFISAGFHKPHLPFVAPKKYFDLYPPEKITLPPGPADDRKDVPEIAFTRGPGDDTLAGDKKRQAIAAYYACVSFMDAQVGVILEAMDRLKLWDNTVVVFWGDHGFHLGEHGGLWRKMTLFEEVDRVPLLVAAPGRKGGVASPRLAELVDLYPTLAELCGLAGPGGLEGTSLVPLLDEPNRPWKQGAFTVVQRAGGLGRSVRTERWRYSEWPKGGAELYDHQTDLREYTNLANDPKHTGTVAELKRLLSGGWQAALPPAGQKLGAR